MAAVTVGELLVKLGADVRDFERGMDRAARRIDRAGRQMEQVGQTLALRVTLPLTLMGGAAVKAAADFETAMTGVAKTVDAPAEQIDTLGRIFQAMSERIPLATNALAELGERAGQLGIALKNIPAFVRTIAALRVATNLGNRAAFTVARIANVMQVAQQEVGRLGDVFVKLGNTTASNEREIADFAMRIAGAGRIADLSASAIAAIGASLASVGVKAEAGGTAVQKAIIQMNTAVATGGDALGEFARVAGMSVEDFVETWNTRPIEAFIRFIEGLRREGDRAAPILDELFTRNERLKRAFLSLASAGNDLRDNVGNANQAWEEGNALTEEAGKFYDRLAADFTRLRNKAVNIAVTFGQALRPAVDRIVDGANELLDITRGLVRRFARLAPETRVQAIAIAGLAAALGPALIGFGAMIRLSGLAAVTLTTLVRVISNAARVFKLLGLAMNPVGLAVLALISVLVALRDHWGTMAEFAVRAWDAVVEAAGAAFTGMVGAARITINALVGAFVFAGEAAVIVWHHMRDEFKSAFNFIRDKAKAVLGPMGEALAFLGRLASNAAAKIRGFFTEAAEKGGKEGASLGEDLAKAAVDAFGKNYVAGFLRVVKLGIAKARSLIQRAIEAVRNLAGTGADIDALLKKLRDANKLLKDLADGAGDAGDDGRTKMDALAGAVENVAGAFADSLGGAITDVGDALKNFVNFAIQQLIALAARFALFKLAIGLAGGPAGLAGVFGETFLGFTIPKAHGGPVFPGRAYEVGEQGRELFVPQTAGTLVPNHALGGGRVVFDFSGFPAARNSLEAARDAEWQRFLRASAQVAAADGSAEFGGA